MSDKRRSRRSSSVERSRSSSTPALSRSSSYINSPPTSGSKRSSTGRNSSQTRKSNSSSSSKRRKPSTSSSTSRPRRPSSVSAVSGRRSSSRDPSGSRHTSTRSSKSRRVSSRRNSKSRSSRRSSSRRSKPNGSICSFKSLIFVSSTAFVYFYYFAPRIQFDEDLNTTTIAMPTNLSDFSLLETPLTLNNSEKAFEQPLNISSDVLQTEEIKSPQVINSNPDPIIKKQPDIRKSCPVDTSRLSFIGFDVFPSKSQSAEFTSKMSRLQFSGESAFSRFPNDFNLDLDYFTGALSCTNCGELEVKTPDSIVAAAGVDALPFAAKCISLDCNYPALNKLDSYQKENCRKNLKFSCQFAPQLLSTPGQVSLKVFDEEFPYKITPEAVECRQNDAGDCPPCVLKFSVELKESMALLALEIVQFAVFLGAIAGVLYSVGKKMRERSKKPSDTDSSSDEDELIRPSKLVQQVQKLSPTTSTLARVSTVGGVGGVGGVRKTEEKEEEKKDVVGALDGVDFSQFAKQAEAKGKKVVSEEEFERMKGSGQLEGKRISKLQVTSSQKGSDSESHSDSEDS